MNRSDERMERVVSEILSDLAPTRLPAELLAETEQAVDGTRRWPRWFAAIKEPPMRYRSSSAVGSPTVRLAAVFAATLLLVVALAGAGLAGSRLLAASGPIIVDQSGAGTFTTIGEGVAEAEDGDTVLIRPGSYIEAVVVEQDITLKGDGPRDQIILTAPEDGPRHFDGLNGAQPYALLLLEADATVEGVTLRGKRSELSIDGGAPVVSGVALENVGQAHTTLFGLGSFLDSVVLNDTHATITGNRIVDSGAITIFEGAPQVVDNTLSGGSSIHAFNAGDEARIADNVITDSIVRGIGIFGPTRMTIEDNTVRDVQDHGIDVGMIRRTLGNDPIVRDNTVEGSAVGIYAAGGTNPTIAGNRVCGNDRDLVADNDKLDSYIATNEVCVE